MRARVHEREGTLLRLNHVTFACEDPQRVCEFWAGLLGGYRGERGGDDDWFACGDGPELRFARMPKSPTIELPIHLDVNVPDREAELERLLGLGGRLVETKSRRVGEIEETCTVMRDPEGNGFCIQAPPNALPNRYLGNVTFSCAQPIPLGRFGPTPSGGRTSRSTRGFSRRFSPPGWTSASSNPST